MDHLPMLRSLMKDHFNVKMLLPNFCPLGKSLITIPKVVLGLQKKVGDQLHGVLVKYVRVDARLHFTT